MSKYGNIVIQILIFLENKSEINEFSYLFYSILILIFFI